MVVLIVERVSIGLRGELSRWMIEPKAGVFVGSVSGMVRDKLWERVVDELDKGADGGALLLHSSNTEQGFAVRTHGRTSRLVVEFEGLQLVVVPPAVGLKEKSSASKQSC